MKVPVDRRRTIKLFIIFDLIFAVGLFLSCFTVFIFNKWGIIQICLIALFVIVSVLMLVLSLTRNFYVIEKKYLVVVKGTKEMYYHYDDVVYIDMEQSAKKKTLIFFTNKGHSRYLPFDRDQEIFKVMQKRCHNLLSKEQFEARYPNVKL